MKKTCSIFVITLILCLDLINASPVFASNLGKTCSETSNVPINKETNENHSNSNIKTESKLNGKNDDVLEVFDYAAQKLYITAEDIDLMAKLVYAESIGEPYAGKIAVASVVLNRTMDPHFPNTIREVILQKNAFSCVKNGKINANPNQDCYNAVYDAIKGADPTNEALFFYNPSIATCSWMRDTEKINQTTIGHHTFFKIKA
jgi:N-acetylmuramoyl-L-alanine amidase